MGEQSVNNGVGVRVGRGVTVAVAVGVGLGVDVDSGVAVAVGSGCKEAHPARKSDATTINFRYFIFQ
jgi:hypothetical protein